MSNCCDKCGIAIDPNDKEAAMCLRYWDLCPDCREEEIEMMFEAQEENHAPYR